MTDPGAALTLKALADFWADMGLSDEAEALTLPSRPAGGVRPTRQRAPQSEPQGAPDAPRLTPNGRPEPRRLMVNPANDARKLAEGSETLQALKAAIEGFDGCPLKQASRNTVVCDGAFDAPIMIVGEAPGAEEDVQGLPFVGRSGKLLDRMLATVGLSRTQNVYITNLVYWRPPGNRDPSPAEMQICAPFLKRQIELKRPKLLLTAGKFATQAMLGTEDGIMRLRGRRMRYKQDGLDHIPCIPLLHPSYLLRRPQDKAKAWDDLLTIAAVCDELGVVRGESL